MALKVEHEIHERRRGRNVGLLAVLGGVVALVFGLTVVKVLNLETMAEFERFDHVARPALEVAADRETPAADPANEEDQ